MSSTMIRVEQTLRWVQPRWNHRHYELKDGDRTVARIEYRGSWKPTAHIILDNEELLIRRQGVLRAETLVMSGDTEIARFQHSGKDRNTIAFKTGRNFKWARTGFWSSTYSFTAPDNDVLMTFKSAGRFFRSEAVVQLAMGSSKYPESRVLLAFGWYLMLASKAAATAAAAG